MDEDVISVTVGVDQEECARTMAHYDLSAIPVVDENGQIMGVITHDDIVDVLEEEATEDGEKILVVALGADPTFLDPESVMNNESGFVMAPIFDGLTKYKKGTSEPGPGLAESWEVSDDGTHHVSATIRNDGWISTYITRRALEIGGATTQAGPGAALNIRRREFPVVDEIEVDVASLWKEIRARTLDTCSVSWRTSGNGPTKARIFRPRRWNGESGQPATGR